MAKWRAVVAVPVVYDLEYASDITTAMGGAQNILKNLTPVIVGDSRFEPKLLILAGPKDEVDKWGKEQRERRSLPSVPSGPSIGGGDDGPAAA